MSGRNDRLPEAWVVQLLQRARDAGVILREEGAQFDNSGWSCRVVHAVDLDDHPWILRAARDQATARAFIVEHAALRVLGTLSVHVPRWHLLDTGLVAYRRLEGSPAAIEDPTTLTFDWSVWSADRSRYARELAGVVAELHAFDPPAQVTVITPHEARRSAMELLVAPEAGDLPTTWRRALDAWIGDASSWTWAPRLLHGDLHPGHTLLVDQELSGIIDWTDVVADDPAREFVYLAWCDDPVDPILHKVVRTYGRSIGWLEADFDRRVDGYADLKVVELLVRGRRNGNGVLAGAALQRLLSRPRLAGWL